MNNIDKSFLTEALLTRQVRKIIRQHIGERGKMQMHINLIIDQVDNSDWVSFQSDIFITDNKGDNINKFQ